MSGMRAVRVQYTERQGGMIRRWRSRRRKQDELYASETSRMRRQYRASVLPSSNSNENNTTSTSSSDAQAEAEEAPSATAAVEALLVQGEQWKALARRLTAAARPYFASNREAQLRLASVLLLSLAGTGVSVGFTFLGRDLFSALSEKDAAGFTRKLALYPFAYAVGIPVFVYRDFFASRLSLAWREWMTRGALDEYLRGSGRAYYELQAGALVGVLDNPDQRLNEDIRAFTGDALGFVLTLFSAAIDLVSFSGILYSIYPPLFVALLLYSVGGTVVSILLGRPLLPLNVAQERKEADFRYALVRVRENAESIGFYRGESRELDVLLQRFGEVVDNLKQLLVTSRNVNFFTSFYRLLIQVLPVAVVAPLYFKGDIEFGVVTQASSAFNHILSDVSLVVFQLESIAGFSAVITRLGQFEDSLGAAAAMRDGSGSGIRVFDEVHTETDTQEPLLEADNLTLETPGTKRTLVSGLSLKLRAGESVLVTGASGSGKTSLLRALAGLWRSGSGTVTRRGRDRSSSSSSSAAAPEQQLPGFDIFFLPQRPYMVLGSLRSQILYPAWTETTSNVSVDDSSQANGTDNEFSRPTPPSDDRIHAMLARVGLGDLLERSGLSLDDVEDWAPKLSLGEQQRLAFARLLLAAPTVAVLDESTSALDEKRESLLYQELRKEGIAFISVGHRSTLEAVHDTKIVIEDAGSFTMQPLPQRARASS